MYMRYFGIDFGLSKIGIALGDDETKVTDIYDVIVTKGAEQILQKSAHHEGVNHFIVGKPNFKYIPEQEEARVRFVEFLSTIGTVTEIDESFTTKESQALQKAGKQGKEDAIAAQLILDAYFSQL